MSKLLSMTSSARFFLAFLLYMTCPTHISSLFWNEFWQVDEKPTLLDAHFEAGLIG